MREFARGVFQALLRKLNRQLVYIPPDVIGGISVGEDIRLMIGKQSPVCLDVGANEGQTISFLRKYFDRPEIHAFEPSSEEFSVLAGKHGDVARIYNIALGDRAETRQLSKFELPVMNSLLPMDQSPDNPFRDMKQIASEQVEVTTLDRFLEENSIRTVDLLKIDTQGFDLNVLRGAEKSLASGVILNVYIELNFVPIYAGQFSAREIDDFLVAHDFKLVDLCEKGRMGAAIGWCNALYTKQQAASPSLSG